MIFKLSTTLTILPDNPIMMTKKIMFLFFCICIINSSFANSLVTYRTTHGGTDTVRKIVDVVIASNELTRGMQNLDAFDVYNNTMYLVNKNRLLQIDLNNGAITTNNSINNFLTGLQKRNKFVWKLKAGSDGFFATVFNDLYFISNTGIVKPVYHTYGFFLGLNSVNDKLLVATQDSVELISKSGQSLSVFEFPLASGNGFIPSTVGLHYNAMAEDSIVAFEATGKNVISSKRYPPVADVKTIKDPFVSYVSDKYFVVIPYTARNVIHLVSKNDSPYRIYKSFSLKGCTPGNKQLEMEEGAPNFKIAYDGKSFFVAAIAGGHLRIFSFTP